MPYMCNLYSETKGQDAIRELFRTTHDRTGNLPAFPGIFPDQRAPIVRSGAGWRAGADDGPRGRLHLDREAGPPKLRSRVVLRR
jgi:hypothetical protein